MGFRRNIRGLGYCIDMKHQRGVGMEPEEDFDELEATTRYTVNDFMPPDVKRGRPPRFTDAEELGELVAGYFNGGCNTRTVVIGHGATKRAIELPMPTITGLAIWLGFESRQSFYDNEKKPEFSYILKKAHVFIERDYEELLRTTPNATGIIFALKQFGWKDSHEVNTTVEQVSKRERMKDFFDEPNEDDPTAERPNDLPVNSESTTSEDSEEV